MSSRGFTRTENGTRKLGTPRTSGGPTRHVDPASYGAQNGGGSARKASPSPHNPTKACAGTGGSTTSSAREVNKTNPNASSRSPSAMQTNNTTTTTTTSRRTTTTTTTNNNKSGTQQQQQNQPPRLYRRSDTSSRRFSAQPSFSGHLTARQPAITPRLEARLERLQQAQLAEEDEATRIRTHRSEVFHRAIENEVHAKERAKTVIESHNHTSYTVQEQKEMQRRDRLAIAQELEQRAKKAVEQAKKERNEWANRTAAEQERDLQEKNMKHALHLQEVQNRTLENNRIRRQKLEERREWQAYEAEQREAEKRRQEEERQLSVQQNTNEHREKFLGDKRAHQDRVLAAQRRNEELMKQKIREEEAHMAQKDQARRSAIEARNQEIRLRQRTKFEKEQEVQRNIAKATDRRRSWEADVNGRYEETCWIAAQTKAFNTTHRKKYVASPSNLTSRSQSTL